MEDKKAPLETFKVNHTTLYAIGPPGGDVCLYFSLSGEDSLTTPPFCNPAQILANKGFRVISATLPNHENNQRPMNIRDLWGDSPENLERFFFAMEQVIDQLNCPIIALGLSRGAFIATHLAARCQTIHTVIGYAPLTHLEKAPHLDLIHLKEAVKEKHLHYFIGHNDTLVETSRVIQTVSEFMSSLTAKQLREAAITLTLSPSIGRDGHGTSDQTFAKGISWICS